MEWWQVVLSWDWLPLWKSAIGAGFGTAIVSGLLIFYRDHRQRKTFARYMALRLAVILEAYAANCAAAISDNARTRHSPAGEAPGWKTKLPELPPYPENLEGWRAMDTMLAGQCLNLRNKIHATQSIIDATFEHYPDAIVDPFNEPAAERGLEAWHLAAALRRRYDIEEADIIWDYAQQLTRMLEEAKQSHAVRSQMQKADWAQRQSDESNEASLASKTAALHITPSPGSDLERTQQEDNRYYFPHKTAD